MGTGDMERGVVRQQQTKQIIFKLIWVQCTLFSCAVATQGEIVLSEWTTSYKVHLSTDEVTWSNYKENNVDKVTKITYSCPGVEIYKEIIKLSQ